MKVGKYIGLVLKHFKVCFPGFMLCIPRALDITIQDFVLPYIELNLTWLALHQTL